MALQDKLRAQTQPFLEPGEQIETIFPAQGGSNPWFMMFWLMFGALGALIGMKKMVKPYFIARTDRSLVIVQAGGLNGTTAKGILKRLPRETSFGPLKGAWGSTVIDGEKIWIHWKFKKDAIAPVAG